MELILNISDLSHLWEWGILPILRPSLTPLAWAKLSPCVSSWIRVTSVVLHTPQAANISPSPGDVLLPHTMTMTGLWSRPLVTTGHSPRHRPDHSGHRHGFVRVRSGVRSGQGAADVRGSGRSGVIGVKTWLSFYELLFMLVSFLPIINQHISGREGLTRQGRQI